MFRVLLCHPVTPLKVYIVKGKIKRIDKKDLSHIGFVNQYKTTVVLWGADPSPHIAVMKMRIAKIENDTKHIESEYERLLEQSRLRSEIGIMLRGDEVRCSFRRDQTYSLRHLNTDDFVEIRGNVVSHSLGKYGYIWYHLTIENCVLINHHKGANPLLEKDPVTEENKQLDEDKDDASISTD